MTGKLYLIPNTLGSQDPLEVMPISVQRVVMQLDTFIVENEKSARRFIKNITPKKEQATLQLMPLNKHVSEATARTYLDICEKGISVGLLSEAGLPAVADPGATIVQWAHEKGISVVPLVGPSSIFMAMMSSGMNGQHFAFNGYLPIDKGERKKAIQRLEKRSQYENQSQLFIETPYRNEKLFSDLITTLHAATRLCIAMDLTLPTEYIKTLSIKDWKTQKPELHKRPAIFVIHHAS